eukprot:38197_1
MSDSKDEEKQKMDLDIEDKDDEEEQMDILLKAAALSSRFYLLSTSTTVNNQQEEQDVMKQLLEIYDSNNMIEFYRAFCDQNSIQLDDALTNKWQANKTKLLKENSDKKELAEKNEGDVEIHDVELEHANIVSLTGTLTEAITAFLEVKGLTTGKEIDKYLTILRLCLAWNDHHLYTKHMQQAAKLIEKGGDWDRRNRFTVYTAAHYFRIRKFKDAAQGLLESIATFSATEIFDYEYLVKYVILSSVLTLDRSVIKDKLIESPEIIQIIDKLGIFKSLLYSFYECRYNEFFRALIEIMHDFTRFDVYLNLHSNYFLRAIRLRAYSQFLESYRSVKLSSMAEEFGVGVAFLDGELSSFIASNKLNCKIDKVNGIVHINRTHSKNTDYERIIKKGDLLLNRIQRLSRIITY